MELILLILSPRENKMKAPVLSAVKNTRIAMCVVHTLVRDRMKPSVPSCDLRLRTCPK